MLKLSKVPLSSLYLSLSFLPLDSVKKLFLLLVNNLKMALNHVKNLVFKINAQLKMTG